jgi:hypothetical protein
MRSASGDIGFPTPAISSSFPTGLAVFTEHRPRLTFVNRFILLALRAPSECFRPIARHSLVIAVAPSLGLPAPLRDIDQRHRYSGLPTSRRLPSSAFLTPSTV